MQSVIQLLGVPREFGITILALTLAFALMPYLAGYDFGIVRLPSVEERKARMLRRVGPLLFAIALGLHLPIIKPRSPDLRSLAVVPFTTAQLDPRQLTYANVLTSRVTAALQADSTLRLVSPRSARLLAERDHAGRVAAELNVEHVVEGNLALSEGGAAQFWLTIVRGDSGRTVLSQEFCTSGTDSETSLELMNRVSAAIRAYVGSAANQQASLPASSNCEDASLRPSPGRAMILLRFSEKTSMLTPPARAAIEVLAGAMKSERLANVDFTITGHVAPSGDPDFDNRLSLARAISVKASLIEFGVDSHRVATRGRGGSEPVNPSEPNARENERVTVTAAKR